MTKEDEEFLADLLLHWDELREQGQEVSSIELCQSCPHLVDELERRIRALKASDWMDKPIGLDDTDSNCNPTTIEPRTLVGRYRLDVLIAEGGFAQVWRSYDLELHRNVAVKLPKPSRLDSTDAFIAEARRVARLKHPGIVPVYDVGRENGNVFIVSEFVEGGNLGDHIRESDVSTEKASRWVSEIAEALEYAHSSGVIHRDIKPANILIDHHGRALLADFGIAQSATKTGQFAPSIGTLRYMAPEQLEGNEVDARSDVYSLGVVLYELLTGKLPYSLDLPNTVRQEIVAGVKLGSDGLTTELRRICENALQLDPQNRFQTARTFAAQLGHRPHRSRGNGFVHALLVLTLALGLGAIVLWRHQPLASPSNPTIIPLDAQWIERIAELPAEKQVIEVTAKLKELNPGFDGDIKADITDQVVTTFDMRTDNVTDIRPLKVFRGLKLVNLSGTNTKTFNGQLRDVSPLAGLQLEELSVSGTKVSDLTPLTGMPLKLLVLNNTRVRDLSPLAGMSLNGLDVYGTQVDDISVVKGMKLNYLHVAKTNVADLSPIAGMPLNIIYCQYAKIESIDALRGMPLELIELHGNPIADLSPLTNSTLNTLNARETKIEDWSALRSMLSLRIVWLDFVKDRDSEVLKSIPTLAEINGQSVQGFWKSVETPSSYEEAVELGDRHFDQHHYEVAIKHYTTAIGFDSTKPYAYVKRGECHFHLEAYKDSLSDFNKATELESNNPLYLDKLANANFHLRNFDDAIDAMENAIALNPLEVDRFKKSLATMLSNRAFKYSQEKKYSDAIADLDKALDLDPDSISYHRNRANCYFHSGNHERALADFDEAIRRDPQNSNYYMTRGYCLNALGRNEEADKDFKKAEELGRK